MHTDEGKRYISDYNLPMKLDGRAYIIQSAMGTGKSQFIKKLIENATVLYVSCRKSFSRKIQEEFNLKSYENYHGVISAKVVPRIVV